METKDLSKLSVEELQAELKKRETAKQKDRDTYKEMVEETIEDFVISLQKVSDFLSIEKLKIFQGLKGLLDLKRNVYDTKEAQQTYSFTDKKGNSIVYGFRILDRWDDTVDAGIEKVEAYLESLATDDKSKMLIKTIRRLLKKNAKGDLKANRVIELTQMAEESDDANFKDGVDIIRKAYKPVKSAFFIDAYYTNAQGVKKSIPLSISSVDFPVNTDVDKLFYVSDIYLTN